MIKRLGGGTFGDVYHVTENGKPFAAKFEKCGKLLRKEFKIYEALSEFSKGEENRLSKAYYLNSTEVEPFE